MEVVNVLLKFLGRIGVLRNFIEFYKLEYEPKWNRYRYCDGNSIKMCIVGCFLMSDVRNNPASYREKWALDDRFTSASGNITCLEKEDGYILLTDMYSEERFPTVCKMMIEQFVQLLDDWETKVLSTRPKNVTIKCEDDEFSIETSD